MRVVHIAGQLNPVADLLSRWHLTSNNFQKLQELVDPVSWVNVSANLIVYYRVSPIETSPGLPGNI